jgi:hypothetical protein
VLIVTHSGQRVTKETSPFMEWSSCCMRGKGKGEPQHHSIHCRTPRPWIRILGHHERPCQCLMVRCCLLGDLECLALVGHPVGNGLRRLLWRPSIVLAGVGGGMINGRCPTSFFGRIGPSGQLGLP